MLSAGTLLLLAALAAPAPAPETLEEGELIEVLAPVTRPLEPEPPPARDNRLSLRVLPGHPIGDLLFVEVQYERLSEPRKSWTAGAGYRVLQANDDVLEYEFRGGPRWYFNRGHEGVFTSVQGLLALNGGDTPVLLAVPVSGGFLRSFAGGNWVAAGELGIGIGYYVYPSPVRDPFSEETEYKTGGVIGFLEVAAGVGYRF